LHLLLLSVVVNRSNEEPTPNDYLRRWNPPLEMVCLQKTHLVNRKVLAWQRMAVSLN